MRWQHLYVAAVASRLPRPASTAAAVRDGLLEEGLDTRLDYTSVLVEADLAAPDLAVRAGATAVARAGIPAADYRLVLHGSLWFQGIDMWATASYVADRTVGPCPPAFDIQQRSNAGMGGLELAAAHLTAGGRGGAALVTTGDRFAAPAIDRWHTHGVCFYGDAGTALVLSARAGFGRVLSTASVSDNALEAMGRGTAPLTAWPPKPAARPDLVARYQEFAGAGRIPDAGPRLGRVLLRTRDDALTDAGARLSDIAYAVLPATRRGRPGQELPEVLGIPDKRTNWGFGRRTGHLGAGDQFAGLENALLTGEVAEGDLVLLFGGGAGYSCTAAVLQITEVPQWVRDEARRAG